MSNDLKNNNSQIQENLEISILKYQRSLLTSNKQLIEKCYREVCKIYPPLLHMQEWYSQYHYLYDSHEDFESDYIKIFCNVLSNWKPRSKRKISRYNGTGEFKNYFIGALQHNYINLVKADNAGKRNPSQKCPICEKSPEYFKSPEKWHLDHDPVTKKFRGWLCESCNMSIGNLGDNIEGLTRALNYLLAARNLTVDA